MVCGRSILVTLVLLGSIFLIVPGGAVHDETECSDYKPLGEPEWAECPVHVEACHDPPCSYTNRVTITVTADPGLEGSATPLVGGWINGEGVCFGFSTCTGTYEEPPASGTSDILCAGYGIHQPLFLAIEKAPNAIHAFSIECSLEQV